MGDLSFPGEEGVSRLISDTPPAHYTLKLQLFSQLAYNKIESYTSNEFEAGGCKWKLVLHPNGNKSKGITDSLSLYLVIVEPHSLGSAWEIRAVFRLFLLDQNKDCYLSIQDTAQNERRFHRMKPAWGFDKFIPLDAFKDAANGYLLNDTCVFGAEVYVCREQVAGKGESLSMITDAVTYTNISRFDYSNITTECVDSKPFNAAEHQWKLQFYPLGKGSDDDSISLYLTLAATENLPPASKIYAEFTISIQDQLKAKHYIRTSNYWFSASSSTCGWPRFASSDYFYAPSKGLLVKDICIVEAKVKVLGVSNAI